MIEATYARKDDMTQILILLEKGFKFSHDNETISFFVKHPPSELLVVVRDALKGLRQATLGHNIELNGCDCILCQCAKETGAK